MILGAGFSAAAGQPLTRDILPNFFGNNALSVLMRDMTDGLRAEGVRLDSPLDPGEDIETLLIRLRAWLDEFEPNPKYRQEDRWFDNHLSLHQRVAAALLALRHEAHDLLLRGWYTPCVARDSYDSFGHGAFNSILRDSYGSLVYGYFQLLMIVYWLSIATPYEPLLYSGPQDVPWDSGMPEFFRRFARQLPAGTWIATTNYDDVLERALLAAKRSWSYAGALGLIDEMKDLDAFHFADGTFYVKYGEAPRATEGTLIWSRGDWRPPLERPPADIVVCRLHGSFRWIKCRDCERVYSVDYWACRPDGTFLKTELSEALSFRCWNLDCAWIPLVGATLPEARKRPLGKSAYVRSPFLYPAIHEHWFALGRAARTCEQLVIIGCAIREADQALVGLVRNTGRRAKRVILVDPAEATRDRLSTLLGRDFEWIPSFRDMVRRGTLARLIDVGPL